MKLTGKLINLDDCKIEVIHSCNELPKIEEHVLDCESCKHLRLHDEKCTSLIYWLEKRIQEEHDAMRTATHENGIRMHASARDAFHEVLSKVKEVKDDK